jgi:hypothetical protein
VTEGINVPGKIQEFLLVTLDACVLSEKIQGLACVSGFNRKKQNISITFRTHFRIFQSLKT